jgi:hypothetical protein
MKHSHSFAMTIFHKITKSAKLVILLIVPTYAKVSMIYLLMAIRGMNDCLPKDSHLWLSLEKIIFDTFIAYGFKNIRTPVVGKTWRNIAP